jgi:hypothetical protein
MRILFIVFIILLACAPAVYTVVTDDVSKYQGEGLNKFYVIQRIDTLHTPNGTFYRIRVQEIPKE